MLKLSIILIFLTPLSSKDKKCNLYNEKFMRNLHLSLELECDKKDLSKHKTCRRLLSKTTYYNKLRSKYCYEED